MRRISSVLASLAVAAALVGCSDGGPSSSTLHAFRITSADQLLTGRAVRGQVGDYKIHNDKVAFVIQDVGRASGYQRYGGMPVDADVVRPAGEAGGSQLGMLFFGYNQRIFEPQVAEVVADGSNGKRAIIRVTGQDGLFEWLASFMSGSFPMDPIDCELVYEYSLGPDDEALQIDVTIRNRGTGTVVINQMEAVFIMGDGLKPYFEGPGFDEGKHTSSYPYWLGLGDQVAYGLLSAEGQLSMITNLSNVALGTYRKAEIPTGQEVTVTRYLVVAAGGLDRVQRIFRTITDESAETPAPVGTLRGSVTAANPEAFVRGVRLHVLEGTRHRSVIRVQADGTFATELPPGSYQLLAKADGFAPSELVPVTIVDGQETPATVTLPTSTQVLYTVVDGDGLPSPARISFFYQGGDPPNVLEAMFGEESHQQGAALVIYSANGSGDGLVPDGSYEVIATRGTEYEMVRAPLEAFGGLLGLEFTLTHAVDSSGWLAGDFHLHGQPSPDVSIAPEHRVRTGLSEGLGLLPMTDHDTIFDYTAAVAAVPGAGDLIHAVVASEITTYIYGHFNAWPLTEKPTELNHGGIEWFNTTAPDLFARMRAAEAHDIVIQVNHPRSISIGGYFSAVGLDRDSGTVDDVANWSEDFDVIEVFNGSCSNGDSEVKLDWFDTLSRGYKFSVSGGSDSHSEPAGVPRVYVPTTSSPRDFDPAELAAAFKQQRVYVSCGPVVAFTIDGQGLGETVTAAGDVSIQLRIEAPSWMEFAEARLVRNGAVAWSQAVAQWTGGSGAVRLDETVVMTVAEDSWLVFEVVGAGNLWPVDGTAPYALTNPIYVDVDGNGQFDAPLAKYRAPGT